MVLTQRVPSDGIGSGDTHERPVSFLAIQIQDKTIIGIVPALQGNPSRGASEIKGGSEVEGDAVCRCQRRPVQRSRETIKTYAVERLAHGVINPGSIITKKRHAYLPTRSTIGVIARLFPTQIGRAH